MARPPIGDEAWEIIQQPCPVRKRRFRNPTASRSTVDWLSRRFRSFYEGASRGTTYRST